MPKVEAEPEIIQPNEPVVDDSIPDWLKPTVEENPDSTENQVSEQLENSQEAQISENIEPVENIEKTKNTGKKSAKSDKSKEKLEKTDSEDILENIQLEEEPKLETKEELDEFTKIDFDEIKDSIEEIITGNWHGDHENIAGAFEDIASPKTIEWVYYLALAHQFEGYEGGLAMARKCIHALGKINTPKSKEKLELLANNLNETQDLRESAKRELNRRDFTNKDIERRD